MLQGVVRSHGSNSRSIFLWPGAWAAARPTQPPRYAASARLWNLDLPLATLCLGRARLGRRRAGLPLRPPCADAGDGRAAGPAGSAAVFAGSSRQSPRRTQHGAGLCRPRARSLGSAIVASFLTASMRRASPARSGGAATISRRRRSGCFPSSARCWRPLADLPGCRLARMSGSGPTCFALFGTAAEAAAGARRVVARQPGWWVVPTATLGAPP